MSILETQSPTIHDYAVHGGLVFIFSSGGVDIYRPSYIEWIRVGSASLANVTSGAINDLGIWLGTSDRGVWFTPFRSGDSTSLLTQYYATAGTTFKIQSDAIAHVAGNGSTLLVTHDAGAEYFPAPGTPFQYADASGCGACAVNDTFIAYAVDVGLHTLLLPTADWVAGDATILTTGSSPAISNDTVNHLIYGSGNNLFIGNGSGVDVYDYVDVVSVGVGSSNFVWPTSDATQVLGDVAIVDGNDNVLIIDIENAQIVETHTGDFTTCWIDDQADLSLYGGTGVELERHAFINYISPDVDARNVTRNWTLYFEIGDTIHSIGSVVLKVNDITVSPDISSLGSGFDSGFSSGFGGSGFMVTYTPPSASGYRKTVKVEIIGTDGKGLDFTEITYFTTEALGNASPSATLPPSVILYKDLSLTEFEDIYDNVNVNWADEETTSFIVSEDQASAMAAVEVEKGIYHQTIINIRVKDTDDSANNTQDIKRGDIILINCDALDLTDKKCEVLAKQRNVTGDRIEYNLQVAFYELWVT